MAKSDFPAAPQPTSRNAFDSDSEGLGAVFTRPWVADLVLDLAGYTSDRDLGNGLAVEPSCGSGAFIVPMIDRLAESCLSHAKHLAATSGAIRAWDLDTAAVAETRALARAQLRTHGLTVREAAHLARMWIRHGDFLLQTPQPADWVVGNPPYVRLEDVPNARSDSYRRRWPTMQGRADVYVGFIEAGLRMLRPNGVLAFICADRWMRNQYGKHLRKLVEDQFAVETIVTLHDSDVFENRVAAYPAIFAIKATSQGSALVVDADKKFDAAGADSLSAHRTSRPSRKDPIIEGPGYTAAVLPRWFVGTKSWPVGSAARLALVAELEAKHPSLGDPESSSMVGIGLASGADSIFLSKDPEVVESDRLLPMVMASDLREGKVVWSGTHLINPWAADGQLVALQDHQRLASYYSAHEPRLRRRHVGQRQPDRWYRTIDRPIEGLAQAPKLLLPDLRMRVTPVLEAEGLYPHHNLFWVTTSVGDLRVLGGLLLSDFGTLFVETYSPKMAGGALRVTAQYLRRVRVPEPSAIPTRVAQQLAAAFDARDVEAATRAAADAYGVDPARVQRTSQL